MQSYNINSKITLSGGIESTGILFNKVRNLWLKSSTFSFGVILILDKSRTIVASVLFCPNFFTNLVSKSFQFVILPYGNAKYHVEALPSKV